MQVQYHSGGEFKLIGICPRCQQRYSVARGNSDYVHQCSSGDTALDFDDVLVTGSYNDWGGGGHPSKFSVVQASMANDLEGTRAGLEGASDESRTVLGKNKNIYRQRRHFEYIEIEHKED